MADQICPVCRQTLSKGYRFWHYRCRNCRYEASDLNSAINIKKNTIDEKKRAAGLRSIRMSNFKTLRKIIDQHKPSGGKLLDVGSAHGWFIETVSNQFDALGLEPDIDMFEESYGRGLPIRWGYFPGALGEDEKFDIIVFNDVFEHIDDIENAIEASFYHLKNKGLLLINLPSSDGILYKLAVLFCRLGYLGLFERLWQHQLPSPHLHYFNLSNLCSFVTKYQFKIKSKGRLQTLSLSGLRERIQYVSGSGKLDRILYLAVAGLLPFLRILSSDIIFIIAEKRI